MSSEPQNENAQVEIDNVASKYRIRANPNIYTSFVEAPNNFKTQVTISHNQLSHISGNEITTFGKTENHIINTAREVLQSTGIMNEMDFELDLSNIKYSEDILCNSYNGKPFAKHTVFEANKACHDSMLGIPHPLIRGLAGFICNPVVATCEQIELLLGTNEQKVSTTLDDSIIDVNHRFHTRENVKRRDPSLLPHDVADYEDAFGTQFSICTKLTATDAPLKVHTIKGANVTELLMNELNPFGCNGGAWIEPTSVVFKKAVASKNYTYNVADQKFTATAASTTDLFTIVSDGNYYPSNISPEDFLASGISLNKAIWYYNKTNAAALLVMVGSAAGDAAVGVENETNPNQSLIIKATYKGLRAYLPSDALSTVKFNTVHNLSAIKLKKTYRSQLHECLRFLIPYQNELNSSYDNSVNVRQVNYPSLKDVNMKLSVTRSVLRVTQYTVPPSLKIAKNSGISFLEKIVNLTDVTHILPVVNNQRVWDGRILPFQVNTKSFTRVPFASIFYMSLTDTGSNPSIFNTANHRAKLHSLNYKLDAQNYFMDDWNSLDFFEMTKKNGLENYDIQFENGKPCVKPNYYKVTVGNNTYIPQNTNALVQSSNSVISVFNNGTIIVLRWGVDVPLQNNLTASIGGLNSAITFRGTCSATSSKSHRASFYQIDLFEKDLVIGADGHCDTGVVQLQQSDYVMAMNKWNLKVASGRLYVNSSNLRGGSFFSSAVNKISSFLPKILPAIKSGIDYYSNNADTINSGISSLAQGNTSGAIAQLQKLISQ
jgi:hypothetical protein